MFLYISSQQLSPVEAEKYDVMGLAGMLVTQGEGARLGRVLYFTTGFTQLHLLSVSSNQAAALLAQRYSCQFIQSSDEVL